MKLPSLFALALLMAFPAHAAQESYSFDKAHTQILFNVSHLGFSQSWGEFLDYDGHILFNEEDPKNSEVNITIKTASIDMDDEKWDEHMKNEDFFDVEKFPEMSFKSNAIDITGDNTANIKGDLTILGVTKPVTLETKFNKAGKHAFSGKYVAGFSATTQINRSDYGMDYGLPLVGDEVNIILEVEAIRDREPGNE